MHLYKELEEEEVEREFEKNFTLAQKKNWWEKCKNVSALFEVDLVSERFVNLYIESFKNLDF